MTGRVFRGVPASGGVASGTVWTASGRRGGASNGNGSSSVGVDEAFDAVARDLTAAAARLRDGGHAEEADIIAVGALIAEDPVLRDEVGHLVGSGTDPEIAIASVAEHHAAAMEALRDPVLRERAADIRQVARRAAAFVRGERSAGPTGPGPHVLVAE
ncbi:MAG: hypothetical protein M3Q23_12090, partial [Actinomycetota bacterium]|nr:hypothetical protein [Actinomycetota bacterium]